MTSTSVRSKSRFSSGSWETRALNALMREIEGGGMSLNVGIANVDKEGGFFIPGGRPPPGLGPEGRPSPRPADLTSALREFDSVAVPAATVSCSTIPSK